MVRVQTSRRRILKGLGATGIVGLAGCTGGGNETDDGTTTDSNSMTDATTTGSTGGSETVKIGVLQPVSGDLEYYGLQSLWGFYSGLAYKAGEDPITDDSTGMRSVEVDDTTYELYIRDTKFSGDTAQSLATNLVQNEDVDILFGGTSSGAASQVITTVAKTADVPFMVGPAASAGLSSNAETCGDMIFRASENTAMDARSGGKYVAQKTDVSSVYLFGADYSYGRAVVNNFRSVLENEGIDIVGEKFVPQGYAEWDGLLSNAQDEGAEGIVGGFTVATLPNLFTSYLNGDYDYRVFGGLATEITHNVIGQTLAKVLGEPLTTEKISEAKMGPFTTRYHWNQYDNEINDAFVEMYTSAFGKVPDIFTSGTFTAASAIVQAVQESGSTDGQDIAAALRGMTVSDTPKGEDGYQFQPYNNQAASAMTVADLVPTQDEWSDSWGAAVQPSDPVATIGADQSTIPESSDQMDCSR